MSEIIEFSIKYNKLKKSITVMMREQSSIT